ncbi:MAG: hypothetical protein HKN07_12050 [Acidimicrobiia bacterium]|nr:hypothetical protein [Acidimicrobiia bacterium]
MRSDKTLLAAGIAAVLIGLIGMSASIGADGDRWESRGGWPSLSHGRMMGWWNDSDHDEPAPALFDDAEEYQIVAGDLFFEPSRLTVRAATPVNITIVNEGRVFHDLTISELDFHLNADPGQSASGGLEGLAPGEYRFECTVPGHAQAGMVGSVIVEA